MFKVFFLQKLRDLFVIVTAIHSVSVLSDSIHVEYYYFSFALLQQFLIIIISYFTYI